MVEQRRWRPGSFGDKNLDIAMRVIFDSLTELEDKGLSNPDSGFQVVTGTTTVTGSVTGIVTGLAIVDRVIASIEGGDAVNEWVTARPTPDTEGSLDLFAWKPTAVADTTPIASTTAREIAWIAFGPTPENNT